MIHKYLDDNPTETPSDVYPITITLTDDDGGVATASTSVRVNNVAPNDPFLLAAARLQLEEL